MVPALVLNLLDLLDLQVVNIPEQHTLEQTQLTAAEDPKPEVPLEVELMNKLLGQLTLIGMKPATESIPELSTPWQCP